MFRAALRMYAVFLVIAIASVGTIHFLEPTLDPSPTARSIGLALGEVLAIFIISAIVPTIWLIIARKKFNTKIGTALGILIAIILVTVSILGRSTERKLSRFSYTAVGCNHKVIFPQHPEFKNIIVRGTSIRQANLYLRESFLRAECVNVAGKIPKPESMLAQQLRTYAQNNGLSNLTYRIERRHDGIYAVGRGNKTISNIPATFRMIVVLSDTSLLTVLVGSRSTIFPTKAISEFLDTIAPK